MFKDKEQEEKEEVEPVELIITEIETYVDKKINNCREQLMSKKSRLDELAKEIDKAVEKISALEYIKKSKSSMLIIDVLDMIDDYRLKSEGSALSLLDDMEQEVMDIVKKK